MTQAIPLITKDDNFEIIRDKIADILAVEQAAQVALAEAVPLDPTPWQFNVYMERINAWEVFRDGTGDLTPIVNVWYDSTGYNKGASNVATRQKAEPSRYNIDIHTYAASTETAGGQSPGDEAAALRCHHVLKLVRNILMHDKYKYLDMQGIVWRRWPGDTQVYQPQPTGPMNKVATCRFTLEVEHNETIELEDHETCEIISIDMRYEPGGQIIAELDIDFSA